MNQCIPKLERKVWEQYLLFYGKDSVAATLAECWVHFGLLGMQKHPNPKHHESKSDLACWIPFHAPYHEDKAFCSESRVPPRPCALQESLWVTFLHCLIAPTESTHHALLYFIMKKTPSQRLSVKSAEQPFFSCPSSL